MVAFNLMYVDFKKGLDIDLLDLYGATLLQG